MFFTFSLFNCFEYIISFLFLYFYFHLFLYVFIYFLVFLFYLLLFLSIFWTGIIRNTPIQYLLQMIKKPQRKPQLNQYIFKYFQFNYFNRNLHCFVVVDVVVIADRLLLLFSIWVVPLTTLRMRNIFRLFNWHLIKFSPNNG